MKLLEGDCLTMMRQIPDASVDMVLADPPFGITRNAWDKELPLSELWEELRRVIKPNGAIVLHASGIFTAKLMLSAADIWRYNLVWHKTTPTGFLNANRMPLRAHEDICVFYGALPIYRPQKTVGHARKVSTALHKRNCRKSECYGDYRATSYDSTERFPTSVLTFPTDKQRGAFHGTQKPVALEEWLIRAYTDPGDTVLDFCMGSGTTGVACRNAGRRFIGIEKDPDIFQIAAKRIKGVIPMFSGNEAAPM